MRKKSIFTIALLVVLTIAMLSCKMQSNYYTTACRIYIEKDKDHATCGYFEGNVIIIRPTIMEIYQRSGDVSTFGSWTMVNDTLVYTPQYTIHEAYETREMMIFPICSTDVVPNVYRQYFVFEGDEYMVQVPGINDNLWTDPFLPKPRLRVYGKSKYHRVPSRAYDDYIK